MGGDNSCEDKDELTGSDGECGYEVDEHEDDADELSK